MNHSRLLINEPPLMFTPSLALAVGLNEAIFLQQLHYWLEKSNHVHQGERWVYNTYEDWQLQFPFWSLSTLRRTVKSLEDKKVVISDNFNTMKLDKTKWYRMDYERLESLNSPSVQNEQSKESERTVEPFNLNKAIPEITTKITTSDLTTTDEPERLEIQPVKRKPILQYFEEELMVRLSPIQMQKVFAYIDDFQGDEEVIRHAVTLASDKNKRNFAFVEFLLRDWLTHKAETLSAILAYENEKFGKTVPNKQGQPAGNSKFDQFRK